MPVWRIMQRDVQDGIAVGHAYEVVDTVEGTDADAYAACIAYNAAPGGSVVQEPLAHWDILKAVPEAPGQWATVGPFVGTMSQVNDEMKRLVDANGGSYSATGDPFRAP